MASTRILAIAASTSLLFASCGLLDQEAALTSAIDVAVAADVSGASPTEASCVSTTLMANIGIDGLEAEGITADSLGNDPALLRTGVTAAVFEQALISCLDLNVRFAEAIETAQLTSVDTTCVADGAIDEEPLALALIDGDPIVGPETAAPVSTSLADAIRGCVDDTDFAVVTGLDSPAALAEVLIADPFVEDDLTRRDRCIVDGVIDTLGIERLSELGVDVESPDFLAAVSDLSDEERDEVMLNVQMCDLSANLTAFIEEGEIQVGTCAVGRLSEPDVNDLTSDLFSGLSITTQPEVREAIAVCAEEAVSELFGPEPEATVFMQEFAIGFLTGITAEVNLNNFERTCVIRGATTMFDEDQILAVEDAFTRINNGTGSAADLVSLEDLFATSIMISQLCIDPWKAVRSEMTTVGISEETQDCVQDRAPDLAGNLAAATANSLTGGIEDLVELDAQIEAMLEAVESCGTSGELRAWELYMNGEESDASIEA